MCSLLYWLVFTHPALLKWNWRLIRTDTSWLRGCWRLWTGFFESDLEIYTACFPVGHTSGLSTLLCVYQSMLPDLRVKEQRGQKSASFLLDYRHRHMWEVPNYVVKKKWKMMKWFLAERWIRWKRFSECPCQGTTGVFKTWASTDVDIMYSSNFVMSSQKKCYQWSEQTVSVPKGTEHVSLINQHIVEEENVL